MIPFSSVDRELLLTNIVISTVYGPNKFVLELQLDCYTLANTPGTQTLIQMKPKSIYFPKTVDLPCFLFRAAVFIHLKSLFAACFKLCELSFV